MVSRAVSSSDWFVALFEFAVRTGSENFRLIFTTFINCDRFSSAVSQVSTESNFRFIELRVHSNYGNPSYTCLYRFRVHGDPYKNSISND